MDNGSLQTLSAALLCHKVPVVVIGGQAVIYHGFVRATEDLDILFLRTPEAELALLAALTEIEARWVGQERDPATGLEKSYPVTLAYLRSTHVMMLETKLGYLDIFDYVPGAPATSVAELYHTAERLPSGLPVVNREWLARLKRHAGRPRDLADLAQLGLDREPLA